MMIALRHNFDQSKCQRRTVNPRFSLRIWLMADCYNSLCYHTRGIFGSSSSTFRVHGLSFRIENRAASHHYWEDWGASPPEANSSFSVCPSASSQLPRSELSRMPSQASALPLPVQLLYSWPSGTLRLLQFGPLLGQVIYRVCTLMWSMFFLGGQISLWQDLSMAVTQFYHASSTVLPGPNGYICSYHGYMGISVPIMGKYFCGLVAPVIVPWML